MVTALDGFEARGHEWGEDWERAEGGGAKERHPSHVACTAAKLTQVHG